MGTAELRAAEQTPAAAAREQSTAARPIDVRHEIVPLLVDRCLSCHGEKPSGGLRLNSLAAMLQGGDSGAALVPGDAENSHLIARVTAAADDDQRMPPEGSRLTEKQVTALKAWIAAGAEWPEGLLLKSPREAALSHWAFRPIRRPVVPAGVDSQANGNPIDAFVRAELSKQQIQASPEADRETLLRRASLDLIGMPPTLAELDDYLNDPQPHAFERAVDRLLQSPHYGERWARPWLDLCHFADTDGYLTDQLRPVAWRYRQWLIDALNRDLPFDQFTIEQLAGDLLPNASMDQLLATGFLRNTLSNREGGADLEEFRVEQIVDRTTIVGIGWMGLTVGCARCHDHKYDPVTQKDFYRLYAVLDQADEVNVNAPLPGEQAAFENSYGEYRRKRDELTAPIRKVLESLQAAWEARMLQAVAHPAQDPIWDRQWEVLGLVWGGQLGEGQLEGCEIVKTPVANRTVDERDRLQDYFLAHGSLIDEKQFSELKLAELASKLNELTKAVKWPTRAPTMRQARNPRPVAIHVRGDFRVVSERVQPGMFSWLNSDANHFSSVSEENRTAEELPSRSVAGKPSDPVSADEADEIGSPGDNDSPMDRLDLAKWLVRTDHPLTARVVVNRMWQEFFGRGLVDPPDDFGLRGQSPSHPELLDWLASEFISSGWSVKHIHRLIVTSATYRQSSRYRPDLQAVDPQNRLLARQTPLRLSGDQVRDSALRASGLLNPAVGGPSVFPPQPESVASEGFSNVWKTSEGADRYRRGLYTWLQRLSPYSHNVTFDAPPPNSVCTRRDRSNSPLQSLALLNDPVFIEAAEAMARSAMQVELNSDVQRIHSPSISGGGTDTDAVSESTATGSAESCGSSDE